MTKELRQLLLFIQDKLDEKACDSYLTEDQSSILIILEVILNETIKEYLE